MYVKNLTADDREIPDVPGLIIEAGGSGEVPDEVGKSLVEQSDVWEKSTAKAAKAEANEGDEWMAGQVGWKTEAVYGTGLVVDTFVPVLNWQQEVDEGYMRSSGIRAGRVTRQPGALGAHSATAKMELELPNKSIAGLFKHLFGGVSTTGAGPYVHTYTPATSVGKSQTVQGGITDSTGTTQAFTMIGAKPVGWSLTCAVGEYAKLTVDYVGKTTGTATALATATYAANMSLFTFLHGSVTVNATPIASANSVTFTCAKNLRDDRHVLGSRYILEPLEDEHWEYTSEVTADFDNMTLYNLAAAGTQVTSVLNFAMAPDSLVITASGQVVGDAPQLTKIGLEEQTIRLDHSSGTSDANAVTAVLTNTDTTAA